MRLDQQALSSLNALERRFKTLIDGLGTHRSAHRLKTIVGNTRLSIEDANHSQGRRKVFVGLTALWASVSETCEDPSALKGVNGEEAWAKCLTELKELLASVLVEELKGRGSGGQSSLLEAQNKIQVLNVELEQQKAAREGARREIIRLSNKLDDLQKDVDTHVAEAAKAASAIRDLEADNRRLAADLKKAKEGLAKADSDVATYRDENTHLVEQTKYLRQELAVVRISLSTTSIQIQKSDAILKDHESTLNELQCLKKSEEHLSLQLKQTESQLASAKTEAEHLRAELNRTRNGSSNDNPSPGHPPNETTSGVLEFSPGKEDPSHGAPAAAPHSELGDLESMEGEVKRPRGVSKKERVAPAATEGVKKQSDAPGVIE